MPELYRNGIIESTGFYTALVVPQIYQSGNKSSMTSKLEQARIKAGLTRDALAEILDVTETTIYRKERGMRGLSLKEIPKYAAALKCPPDDLVDFKTPEVIIVGEVGAGAEVFPIDDMPLISSKDLCEHIRPDDPLETVQAPAGSDGRGLVAAKLKGDSWKPYHNSGSIVFYENRARPAEECIGEKVIAKIVDGPTLFKVLKRGSKYGHYNLLSPNAVEIEDVEVEWCAVVTDISSKRR